MPTALRGYAETKNPGLLKRDIMEQIDFNVVQIALTDEEANLLLDALRDKVFGIHDNDELLGRYEQLYGDFEEAIANAKRGCVTIPSRYDDYEDENEY